MKTIELLAPARDVETAIAAIQSGADAVYVGGPSHSARAAAHNSLDDIARIREFAHTFGARVYLAVNTLIYDNEFDAIQRILWDAYERGVDALIVQDYGILTLDLPPLPLFASTQMTITTPEKARFLQELGFKRLILERALSLEEIRAIREATTIDLEAFVHGAICISYSGQCYLSYALGGRSGNRGECAQPCRLSYQMLDRNQNPLGHPRYWLSPKDMAQIDHLEELINAGVTSFKIEGRLKDVAYVTNVVSAYRQSLDAILSKRGWKKASLGEIEHTFVPNISRSFNRGFTSYWLKGKKNATTSVLSLYTQKSIGEYIGEIVFANKHFFVLDREHDLGPGDGICYFDERKQLQGTRINSVNDGKVFPDVGAFLRKGYAIYRNHHEQFEKFLRTHPPRRFIHITINVRETASGVEVQACDEQGISATVGMELQKQYAKNPQLLSQTWENQLAKLNATPYRLKQISFQWEAPLFAPVATINELRRQLIERLHKTRLEGFVREEVKLTLPKQIELPLSQEEWDFSLNVVNQRAKQLLEQYGFQIKEMGAETGLDLTTRRVMKTRICLRMEVGLCPRYQQYKGTTLPPPVLEPIYLSTKYTLLRLEFDCEKCEMSIILVSHKIR